MRLSLGPVRGAPWRRHILGPPYVVVDSCAVLPGSVRSVLLQQIFIGSLCHAPWFGVERFGVAVGCCGSHCVSPWACGNRYSSVERFGSIVVRFGSPRGAPWPHVERFGLTVVRFVSLWCAPLFNV
jgi:hypothetical protein